MPLFVAPQLVQIKLVFLPSSSFPQILTTGQGQNVGRNERQGQNFKLKVQKKK